MDETQLEVIKAVAKEIVKDVYNDGLKGGVTQVGEIIESVVGLFNNVVLYPVKLANAKFKYNLADFKVHLEEKLEKIPPENLKVPDLMIAGPVLESLKYTYDKKELRDMYLNLLTSAMDKNKSDSTHPSFADIIRQLSPIDVRFINLFINKNVYPMCDIQEIHSDKSITPYINSLFDFGEKKNMFSFEEYLKLTASLDNLIRLGLLFKNRGILELHYDYSNFKEYIQYQAYEKAKEKPENELRMICSRLELTEFGKKFRDCCIRE